MQSQQIQKEALIIGAGIGGLTTAIALKRIGYKVTVFEKVKELQEVGAGLTLWANAIKALESLGLGKEVKNYGSPALNGQIRNAKGQCLSKADAQQMAQFFGAPNYCFHRADLQEMLLNAVGLENVQMGTGLVKFSQNATGVTAEFSDGRQAQGTLLIGADGIHSAVRRLLWGDEPLRFSGYTAWRGVVEFPLERLIPGESWGRGCRFGIVPLNRGRVYWFATRNGLPAANQTPSQHKQLLLETFKGWYAPVEELLQATPAEAILCNPVYDRPPVERWSIGRVTLLGDAAHPTTPNLGQGACQAIEDAIVLAKVLQAQTEVATALQEYEKARIPRTRKVVSRSWQIGRVGQLENPLLCKVRDWAFRLAPDQIQIKQLKEFAGYEV